MMRKRKGHPVYPLTAAQKFHFFYQNFCPKKEVLNIGTSLTIEMELDMELLKKAIYQAYDRCEASLCPGQTGYLVSVCGRQRGTGY